MGAPASGRSRPMSAHRVHWSAWPELPGLIGARGLVDKALDRRAFTGDPVSGT